MSRKKILSLSASSAYSVICTNVSKLFFSQILN